MTRQFVLIGGGDDGEWADQVFRDAAGGGGHAAVVAAAQAPNGPDALLAQRRDAEAHLRRAGIRTVNVPLLDRSDADDPSAVATLDGAAFVYVLGGQLPPLVAALHGSVFWDELTRRDLSYVGNSAGAMLLGARYPTRDKASEPGLGVFPTGFIAAHWNEMERSRPGAQQDVIDSTHPDTLVAIDGDTAMIGEGNSWRVAGLGGVHLMTTDGWTHHAAGAQFALRLLP